MTERRPGLTIKSFLYALVIHLVLGILLFVSFNFGTSTPTAPAVAKVDPVKATVVSEEEIKKQLDQIKDKEREKEEAERKAKQRLEDMKREAAEAEKKRKAEEQRAVELEKKRKAEQARRAREKKEQQRKQRLAEEKKKKLAEKKRKEELAKKRKLEAEKKKKAEAERKRKLAEEKKRKAEAARKRKLAEEKKRREDALREQLAEEQRQRQVAAALGRYIPIIRQKVSRNWSRPPTTQAAGIAAQVRVQLSPSGDVLSARIIRSSGDPVFDRSVENAVYKASPLPIPQERGVNEEFRSLQLTFKPEDLIS